MQRNRMKEMARWADKLKEVEKFERHVKTALVAANDHYAGFVPTTSNAFSWQLKRNS